MKVISKLITKIGDVYVYVYHNIVKLLFLQQIYIFLKTSNSLSYHIK